MTCDQGMKANYTLILCVRWILLGSLVIFALGVSFHDYPGHDHFSFAHELLSKDAPVEKGDSDPEQEQIKWGWEKGMVLVVDTS
jgi:signal recognition particle receptor subunit beta